MSVVATEPVQLLLYRFDARAGFEGQFVGALERLEAGGTLRILDVLVVGSDAATGELMAIDQRGGTAGGLTGPLVSFRLDAAQRRRVSRRTLERGDARGALARALAATLRRDEVVAAVLIGHAWARALDDAVARMSGSRLASAMVEPDTLTELADEVLAGAGRRP